MTTPISDLNLNIKELDLSKATYKLKAKWSVEGAQDLKALDFFKQEYPGEYWSDSRPSQYEFDF